MKGRFADQRRLLTGVVLLAAVGVSLTAVLGLPAGNPVRIAAGLMLFIALPGVGVDLALLRSHMPTAPWERLAVIGALGLAASGLASVILAVTGTSITAASVGAACASITVLGFVISLVGRGSPVAQQPDFGAVRVVLALVLVVLGGVIGSTVRSNQGPDTFTILAFENPVDARAAIEAAVTRGGPTTIGILVESHELGPEQYEVLVQGGTSSLTFALQPLERRVIELEVSGTSGGAIEIQLLRSGRHYRSLRLSAP